MAWKTVDNLRGPRGPQGRAGTISSVTVAPVPNGTPPSATISGDEEAHLHLELPLGSEGKQGPPGLASSASAVSVPFGAPAEAIVERAGEAAHVVFKIPGGAPAPEFIPTAEAIGQNLSAPESPARPGLESGMAQVAANPESEFAKTQQALVELGVAGKADLEGGVVPDAQLGVSSTATARTIPKRDAGGRLPGVNTPTAGTHAANKEYVDVLSRTAKQETMAWVGERTAVSVIDFGAVRDGSADTTAHVQAAIDSLSAAGGTIWFPPGRYLMRGFVRAKGNTSFTGMGATIVKDAQSVEPVFAALGGSGWVENVTVQGLSFEGALPAVGVNVFWGHRARNVRLDQNIVNGAIAEGHVADLQGCDGVTIERNIFRGSAAGETRGFAEAIQIDHSVRTGAPVELSSETYDGTATANVLVRDNRFEKFGTFNAPRPIGSHTAVEGRWLRNIVFEDNYIERPNVRTTGSLRAVINFMGVDEVSVRRNRFRLGTPVPADVTAHVQFHDVSEWTPLAKVNTLDARVATSNKMHGLVLSVSGNETDAPTISAAVNNYTELAFTDDTNFGPYSNALLRLTVVDGMVNLDGVITCKTAAHITGAARRVFADIPDVLRPPRDQSWVRPGSGVESWTLDALPDGSVSASRYSGTQAAGVWMPVSVQWRRA